MEFIKKYSDNLTWTILYLLKIKKFTDMRSDLNKVVVSSVGLLNKIQTDTTTKTVLDVS